MSGVRPSGVAYMIREMYDLGIRISAGYPPQKEAPEGANILHLPQMGIPSMWWVIEGHFDGDWTTDWEPLAGTLADSIKVMDWVFQWAIIGELQPPRHEWLCCQGCNMVQLLPKAYGAASQKRKCHMTHGCEGIMRRLPNIWAITPPKAPRKPKAKIESTAGALRLRKKKALDVIADEQLLDEAA